MAGLGRRDCYPTRIAGKKAVVADLVRVTFATRRLSAHDGRCVELTVGTPSNWKLSLSA